MENLFSRSFLDTIYTTFFQRAGKGNQQNKITRFDKVKGIIESSNNKSHNVKEYKLSLTFARILTNPADLLGVLLILLYLSQTHFSKYQKVVGDYESKCPLVSLKVTNSTYANTFKDHVLRNVTFIEVNDNSGDKLGDWSYNPTKQLINDSKKFEVLILKDNPSDDIVYLNEPDEEDFNPKNPTNIGNEEELENRKEITKLLNDISNKDDEKEEDSENDKLLSISLIHKYKFTFEFCKKLSDIFLIISLSVTFITSFLELLIMFAIQYLC
uniref:Autophagy-related protein 9 n=1 Tax=Strongyloides venezuelensis TaxID=75913 RepID=A0A0K0FIW7_STRVS